MLSRTTEAKREALDFTKLKRAVLKLGLMCTIAPSSLLDLVRSVRQQYPGVELQLTDATAMQLYQQLESGVLEVAICCNPDYKDEERLHRISLFREQFVIVVSVDHPLAEQNAIRARDLDGQHYLERVNCEYAQYAGRIFEERGVNDRTVYRSDRDDWILAMAAAGLGYAFMPEQCARHPEVAVRPLIEPEIWREISLVTVRGRPYSAAVGALVRETARWRRQGLIPRMMRDDRALLPSG